MIVEIAGPFASLAGAGLRGGLLSMWTPGAERKVMPASGAQVSTGKHSLQAVMREGVRVVART